MTVYVQVKPHAPDAYHLWADTPDEALMAAYACGSGVEAARPDRSPLHYEIRWQHVRAAEALGAVRVATPYEAMEAAARYAGNTTALASLAEWRRLDAAARAA